MIRRRFQIGPHALSATVTGPATAPTFVLIHGIGVSGRYFRPLIRELSRHFQVVCLDLPGFGHSSRPQSALSVKDLADVVAQLLTQQCWPQPILVGHSMGCQIVALLLTQYPHLAAQAVLLSPTTNNRERTAHQQALRLFQDSFHEPLSTNLIVIGDYLACGIPRYLATSRHMLADHIEDHLPHCEAEVLVVRGELDRIAPHDWAAKLTRLLPHGSLAEVPHAPHIVQYQAAAEVARLCAKLAGRP
jgi:pimeloyl-ACP methyl ester carboxylesterase